MTESILNILNSVKSANYTLLLEEKIEKMATGSYRELAPQASENWLHRQVRTGCTGK